MQIKFSIEEAKASDQYFDYRGTAPEDPPLRPERHIPKLNRNHASTADRRARQKPAAMSMLQHPNRRTVAAQKYVTP